MMTLAEARRVLRAAYEGWWADRALSLGAAIAFYTLFALAPVLLAAISVAGLVFGREAAQGAMVGELGALIGTEGASAIETMIASARDAESSILGMTLGIGTFLILASGAFVELQDALNIIWKARPPAHWGIAMIRSRVLSLALIFGIGFVLMVSLAIDAGLTAIGTYLGGALSGLPTILLVMNFALSLGVAIVLFAMIFKVLPEVEVAWHDVWVGAAITGLMFTLGKFLIGFYLGKSGVTSSYGAAASIVTVLLWVYYSSQILLFGAEFTKAYAEHRGSRARTH
jgi:membrane protein